MTVIPQTQQIATSAGHTFICYARYDLAFVLKLATALRDRGIPIWIDQWCIEPGADWNKAIDAALHACANFLIVLSPEAVASDEVRGELTVALSTHKHVIPVLHRPSEIPRQLQLRQWIDFTQSTQVSEASLDLLVRALRKEAKGRDVSPTADRAARQTLLQDVRSEARERLQSTGTGSPVPIQLERQPHQVARPWDDELAVPIRQQPGPPVTDIVEVFDDPAVAGKLLILGEPGSGKTTVLLQLMQQLVFRATQGEVRPVPVLISLASWKSDKPFDAWLVDELKVKYGVRADVGRRWRDEGRIAPLFDGLDELPAEQQQACVEAIDGFQQTYGPAFLVVCCRRAEYENLASKLRLQGAVCLLPLDQDQIRAYLDQTQRSDLWMAIGGDPVLMEMARSPLLLSFMSALPNEPGAQRWQDSPSPPEMRQRLFDAYASSHASPANPPTYSREQTLGWLRRLATMLKAQARAEFLIERMQPDWLESSVQRWSYRAGVIVVSAAAVLLIFLSIQALFELIPRGTVGVALQQSEFRKLTEGRAFEWTTLFVITMVLGSLIALRKTIVPIETLTWSWTRAGRNTRQWAKSAAFAALDYGFPLSVAGSYVWALSQFHLADDDAWRSAGGIVGTAGAALVATFLMLIKPGIWLRQARRAVMRRRIADATTAAVLCGLVSGWCVIWIGGLVAAVAIFLIVGFSTALTDRCRVWLLRTLMASVISGLIIATLSKPALPVPVPMSAWLRVWVGGALGLGIIGGLVVGLAIWWREGRASHMGMPATTDRRWMKTAVVSVVLGVSVGLAAVGIVRAGGYLTVRGIGFLGWWAHAALINSQGAQLFGGIGVTAVTAVTGALLAALAGALSGASGADVERRLVPNQGIRQSALNVVIFAALGILIVGVPYGAFNLSVAMAMTRTLPSAADFLNLGVGAGVTFGLLAGLLPGAACIQHFVLRFVLWASGALPLRCARFLNFATRRRLLQRVGGRYRFIHVLLRDHLAGAQSS